MLHGGSGLTDADFKRAIQEGISKVNIFTDINVAAVEAELKKFSSVKKGIIDLFRLQSRLRTGDRQKNEIIFK